MDITCVSDLHGFYPKLSSGDLLIIGGDLTATHSEKEMEDFLDWLSVQKYRKKILIAGNHDSMLNESVSYGMLCKIEEVCDYLLDESVEFEGLKIWGSPWTRWFDGINPKCTAFVLKTEEELNEKWALIHEDVDILITHGPPFAILDQTSKGEQVGSTTLLLKHLERLRPRLWVMGHVHEAYGRDGPYNWNKTLYINASHVNEHYKPVNKPIQVKL
jgi:Icc-related predicted phosphoesterase